MTDFRTSDHGTVVLIWPVSTAAHDWVEQNLVAEPWQWFGGALGVDHRFAPDILAEITKAGFAIAP
jgi:hypothetical protein